MPRPDNENSVFQLRGINHLALVCKDMQRTVDFYSGVIYKAMGFPTEFFTVLFALPRFTGWMSHWNEFI